MALSPPGVTFTSDGTGPRRSSAVDSSGAAFTSVKLAHRQSARLRSIRLESTAITGTSNSNAAGSVSRSGIVAGCEPAAGVGLVPSVNQSQVEQIGPDANLLEDLVASGWIARGASRGSRGIRVRNDRPVRIRFEGIDDAAQA